jgi:LAO/AO transport system kinase
VAKTFLDEGKLVAIIAIDPTSPFSGGGLLGDRIRFKEIDGKENLFIRSVASRGIREACRGQPGAYQDHGGDGP